LRDSIKNIRKSINDFFTTHEKLKCIEASIVNIN
jgi:hypothetical protein